MGHPRILRFYLEDALRKNAEAGRHNFLGLLADVARRAGFRIEYRPNSSAERLRAMTRHGYGITHMKPPPNDHCLTIRRAYHYPFWQIEATDQRWDFDVARARFDPDEIDPERADAFRSAWRERLFSGRGGGETPGAFVYVPLQGRLLEKRSFQAAPPLRMVEDVAALGERAIVTLHPKETYSGEELTALSRIVDAHPQLTLETGGMQALLPACSVIITQNSSAAFNGLFFDKPAVLYAKVDFHHFTVPCDGADLQDALDMARSRDVPCARYLWWFWQEMAINAGRPDAAERIETRLRALGWPI